MKKIKIHVHFCWIYVTLQVIWRIFTSGERPQVLLHAICQADTGVAFNEPAG